MPEDVAVGVDVSLRRGLDVVAIGSAGRLIPPTPCARVTAEQLERLLGDLQPAVVAIDGPPAWGTPPRRSRTAEVELRRFGIVAYSTPSDEGVRDHPFYGWMHASHAAFAAAARAGFRLYEGDGTVRSRALEVFPHASATALAGRLPPAGSTGRAAEKRAWRKRVLVGAGVDVGALLTTDAVDAGLAAVTARAALLGDFFVVGGDDGYVVLPGRASGRRYAREGLT